MIGAARANSQGPKNVGVRTANTALAAESASARPMPQASQDTARLPPAQALPDTALATAGARCESGRHRSSRRRKGDVVA